jgi:hypothetical protein
MVDRQRQGLKLFEVTATSLRNHFVLATHSYITLEE